MIIENYEREAIRLYHAVKDDITERLTQRSVMGRKRIERDWFEVLISIEGRRVIVLYSEDTRENTRWIESVSIGRKPIIF